MRRSYRALTTAFAAVGLVAGADIAVAAVTKPHPLRSEAQSASSATVPPATAAADDQLAQLRERVAAASDRAAAIRRRIAVLEQELAAPAPAPTTARTTRSPARHQTWPRAAWSHRAPAHRTAPGIPARPSSPPPVPPAPPAPPHEGDDHGGDGGSDHGGGHDD